MIATLVLVLSLLSAPQADAGGSVQPPPPPPPPAAEPPAPPQPAAAPRAPQAPRPAPAPQPPSPPPALLPPDAPPPPPRSLVNVQIELTITDEMAADAPQKKTVSLIVSDGNNGRIRASANARPSDRTGVVPAALNVDALPRIQPNGLIQLYVTMFYQPLRTVQAGDPAQTSPTELNQSLSVLLRDGQPLVVSRAADPVTDRRISVEVKATILK